MSVKYNDCLDQMRRMFKPRKGAPQAMYLEVFGNPVITRGDSNWKINTSRGPFHGKKRQPSAEKFSDF